MRQWWWLWDLWGWMWWKWRVYSSRKGTSACPSLQVHDWLAHIPTTAQTYDVVEVIFKGNRKAHYRNTNHLAVHTGDAVVVEAGRGLDLGTIHMAGELVRLRLKSEEASELPILIRKARLEDLERAETNREKEAEAFHVTRQAIDRLNLAMKLVDAEWQFDRKKITFYFTAQHRVDFRELVKELARKFRTRVELRQIGARDETARIGGLGSCGRELCCSTWLQEFKPVTTQAVKAQQLPLNPTKLSGQCGRLKCCLNYELEQYMAALKVFPKIGTSLTTAAGPCQVSKLDIFRSLIWVQTEDGQFHTLTLAEAQPLLYPAKHAAGLPKKRKVDTERVPKKKRKSHKGKRRDA